MMICFEITLVLSCLRWDALLLYRVGTVFLLDDTLWLHGNTLVMIWKYIRLGLGFLVTIVAVMSLCEEVVLGRLFPVVIEVSSSRLLASPARTNSVALCSRGS